jgi:CBS domain-containing protein
MEATPQDTVRMLMRHPAVLVDPDATLRHVAAVLSGEMIGALVVPGTRPHAQAAPRVRGLVSERDVVRAIAEGADVDRTRASEIMTEDIAFAHPEEGVLDVAHRMLHDEIRHLPVVEDDVVIGVISIRDALQALSADPRPAAS